MTEHDHARAIGAPGGPARGRAQKTEKQPHAKAMRRKWLGQGPAPGAAWRRGGGRGFAEISQNNPPERAVKQEFRKTTLRGADVRPGLKNEFRENNPPEGDQSKFPQNNPMQSRWSTRQRGQRNFRETTLRRADVRPGSRTNFAKQPSERGHGNFRGTTSPDARTGTVAQQKIRGTTPCNAGVGPGQGVNANLKN
jgi:hypothetical protein